MIDTHCHLNFPPLNARAEAAIHRAFLVGVDQILVPSFDHASWNAVAKLAAYGPVLPAFGIHPWVAERVDTERLKEILVQAGAVAIGEIGLDFKLESFDRELQLTNFQAQLDLAVAMDLPVMLHCRGAFEEMLTILAQMPRCPRGVVHAFSRGPELMERFLELGLHVAFGGAITRPGAKQARRSAALAPADRILLETDAPSIGLHEVMPEDVEPRHIIDIAVSLAQVRGESFESIADGTTRNARRLFGI